MGLVSVCGTLQKQLGKFGEIVEKKRIKRGILEEFRNGWCCL